MAESPPIGDDRQQQGCPPCGVECRPVRLRMGGRIFIGLLIIALGVLFTLDNLGVMSAGSILRWWPAALLAYGLAKLTGTCCRRGVVSGSIFTAAGALFLAHEAGWLSADPWDFWPVILVLIGGSMVARSWRRGREPWTSASASPSSPAPGEPSPAISTVAIWSGVEQKVVSQAFRGGEVTAIMGGQDLDLRSARLASGSASIDLFVLWGGVDLRVPENWKVTVEAVTLLGGFEDATRAPVGEADGHLILKGLVLMGGVEVKN